jgi:uncharacterized membrane protein
VHGRRGVLEAARGQEVERGGDSGGWWVVGYLSCVSYEFKVDVYLIAV